MRSCSVVNLEMSYEKLRVQDLVRRIGQDKAGGIFRRGDENIRCSDNARKCEYVTDMNQMWQVGGSVKNGVPEKHDILPENLALKGTMELASKAENQSGNSNSTMSGRKSPNDAGESSRIWWSGLGL